MGKHDKMSSIFLILVSIITCLGSIRIGLGTFGAPGSGFVPFIAGVFLGIMSLLILIKASRENKSKAILSQGRPNLRKVIKMILGLFIYVILLPILGYVVGTFLLMLFLLKGVETLKWRWAVATSILIVIVSYLIFDVWLQGMLPVGLVDIRRLTRWVF